MRNFLIAFFTITSCSLAAQDLGLQFVSSLKGTTSPDLVEINHAQVKSNGTIFTGGYFRGTVDFDPDPVNTLLRTSNEVYDIFIAKYTSEGDLLNSSSVLTAGGAGDQYITDIALSGSSLVVLGNIEGSVGFATAIAGTNTVISNGNLDILLAKFDEGSLTNTWAYNIGGSNVDFTGGLAVDFSGNIYITGSFIGSVDFDPSGNGIAASVLTAPGSTSDIFVAKYNTDGELIWANNFGGGGAVGDAGSSIKVDGSHVYVTGVFNGSVDFDPGPGTATIASNQTTKSAFIAKYDLNGNYVWAKSVVGAESSSKIAINDLGDVAITGYFQVNNADFDPGVGETLLPYQNSLPDAYVTVFNNDGELKWAKSIGGPNSSLEIPEVVSFGEDGSVFVTGSGGGQIDFNQQGSTSYILTSQSTDAFIANYDADGTLNYAYLLGGPGSDYGAKHTIDGGNLIVYGRQRSTFIDFDFSDGASSATSVNLDDSYLAKYDYTPPQIKTNNTGIPTLGSDLLVSVELEDKESGVATGGASIRYRGITESSNTSFKQVTLTKKAGNVFEGTIPSDDFDGVGIEFFGVASNTVGVVGPISTLITSNFNVPDGLTIPQKGTGDGSQEDYRIVSIPLNLNNKSVKSIFEDDLGAYNSNEYRLFTYGDKTTELNANSNLEVGKGYWLIVAGNDRTMNTGGGATVAITRTDPYRLELNPG
ncbi:MAG: SBBP repeat-containing protein, partial [Cyclobacteriaceae bacterium]